MLDSAEGNEALLGVERVPPDGPDLAVGAGQVLQVVDGLRETQVVELIHVVHHEELLDGLLLHSLGFQFLVHHVKLGGIRLLVVAFSRRQDLRRALEVKVSIKKAGRDLIKLKACSPAQAEPNYKIEHN